MVTRLRRGFSLSLGFALLLSATAASAESTPGAPGTKQLPLWELGVGVATLRLPDYRGSDQATDYAVPLPYFVYRGQWLRADREGARAVLFDAQHLEVDLSLAAAAPVRHNPAREGMADLAPRVEFGPSANIEFWRSADRSHKVELRAPVRAAYALEHPLRGVGWTFNPNLNLDLRGIGAGWDLGLESGAVFGDRRFHNYLYGVAASEATPQRPAFEARAGYAGWLARAGISRHFERTWVGAFIRYDSVRGAVFAPSPLVKSEQNWTLGFAASWILSVSDRLVAADR